ncbi:MAG: hypothetical protein PHY43_15215 [Verrucomicrobiales bacterium]|nr:hypothetical protein [Verrucomicrobiales bacterium]
MSSTIQKNLTALLAIAMLVYIGVIFVQYVVHKTYQLKAAWDAESLHIYSAKDGPWVITHLVKMRAGTNEYAVAQLPSPVTVIDSRGEHFSIGFINSLTWITPSGSTSAPPVIGYPMRAYYLVPEQTETTK